MSQPIFVVGHRNPDNDSISSAVAYAYLKNELAKRNGSDEKYISARLGPLPAESAWVLEQNNLEAPVLIEHVYPRLEDVMSNNPKAISSDATVMEAGCELHKSNIRSLIVEDPAGKFLGLISTRAIAERYISATGAFVDGDSSSEDAVANSLVESLHQKVSELTTTSVLTFSKDAILKEVTPELLDSDLQEAVVLDSEGKAIGVATKSDVAKAAKRRVVLVDHNEIRQAVPGIEDAEVVEIIDHHRIADVSTANPIQFLNLPLGSTATIITLEYKKNEVEIPASIAAVLLSAILTDTVVLKSPTTTQIDREQAEFLAGIIGTDVQGFGLSVFKSRNAGEVISVEQLVEADSKEFPVGDTVVLIAQHETVDLEGALEREEEIREHMRGILNAKGYDFVLLLVTDILAEGSQFLVEGNKKVVEKVFGIEVNDNGGNWMPGVLSRKKQVAAKILQ
jgi:manganese-dependent inorganic pyrophosphatase